MFRRLYDHKVKCVCFPCVLVRSVVLRAIFGTNLAHTYLLDLLLLLPHNELPQYNTGLYGTKNFPIFFNMKELRYFSITNLKLKMKFDLILANENVRKTLSVLERRKNIMPNATKRLE
jgi:hypothetical protein